MKNLYLIVGLALGLFLCPPSFAAVAHVAGGCSAGGTGTSGTNAFTFSCTASATNDAVVFEVSCTGGGTPTAVTLTATGWTITALSAVYGSATAGRTATFGAITPNTSAATFTATFTGGSDCSTFTLHQQDEFSGVDTTGGTTTFDAHNQSTNTTGGCSGITVTPANANDAVWWGCVDSVTALSGGYTVGQDDAGGDRTEFKILTGGSGVAQSPGYTSSGAFTLGGVTIKASGGGGAVVRHRAWVIQSQ